MDRGILQGLSPFIIIDIFVVASRQILLNLSYSIYLHLYSKVLSLNITCLSISITTKFGYLVRLSICIPLISIRLAQVIESVSLRKEIKETGT